MSEHTAKLPEVLQTGETEAHLKSTIKTQVLDFIAELEKRGIEVGDITPQLDQILEEGGSAEEKSKKINNLIASPARKAA